MTRATHVPTPLRLSLRAEPSCVRYAREVVAEAVSELGMPRRVVSDVRLCVSEAVSNVVRHAYVGEVGDVHITSQRLGGGVLVVVRDFGSGAPTRRATRAHSSGGFGWPIIRALADRCTVRSTSKDGTEVTMSFGTRLPAPVRR
jgi:anti-sigma regulatory factor (Ser/Thr protein kinase)